MSDSARRRAKPGHLQERDLQERDLQERDLQEQVPPDE
jgi:hypothetical protein